MTVVVQLHEMQVVRGVAVEKALPCTAGFSRSSATRVCHLPEFHPTLRTTHQIFVIVAVTLQIHDAHLRLVVSLAELGWGCPVQ
jgi:hypothetical protein